MREKLYHIPVTELERVMDGIVICNSFWAVHPENGAAFWERCQVGSFGTDRFSPQCNRDKNVSDMAVKVHPGHVVQFIAAAYIGNLPKHLTQSPSP